MSVGIQDALAKLYLKLGGDPEKIKENKNVTDYLDDLADVFKSLIELPIVNSTDNGKVLKVVSGKWSKAEESKVEDFIVHGSFDQYYSSITVEEAYDTIKAAYTSGKSIKFELEEPDSSKKVMPLSCYDNSNECFCFIYCNCSETSTVYMICINSDWVDKLELYHA